MADVKVEVKEEKKKEVIYKGIYRLVNSKAVPLLPIEGVYYPRNEDDIKELEFQVTRGIVTKD